MANKRERASMREGPLADLFRKTDEQAEESRERRPEEGAERASEAEQQASPPEAQTPAPEHRPAAEPARPTAPPPVEEEAAASVPTPKERLRHAFSSDIPENILERPVPPEAYPRERGDLYGSPQPAGAPVLRVVGVGGAGVNAINRMVEAEVEG